MPFSAKQVINIKTFWRWLNSLFSYFEGVLFLVSSPLKSQWNLLENLFVIFSTNVSDQIYRHCLRIKTPS